MKKRPFCANKLTPKGKNLLKFHVQTLFACEACERWFHVYTPRNGTNEANATPVMQLSLLDKVTGNANG